MADTFSFDEAQSTPKTFSFEEATGVAPKQKPVLPDFKGIEEPSIGGFLKETVKNPGDMISRIASAPFGAAEFITAGIGSLAQMDFNAFATLGIISPEKADKINTVIGKVIEPETDVGKFLVKWGGELFTFAPEKAKQFAKKLGASDQTSEDVFHLVEAGELAMGLGRMKGKPKAEEPVPITEPPTPGKAPLEGEVMPKQPAGPALEAPVKAPIEATATKQSLKQLEDLRAPEQKMVEFELAKTNKDSVAAAFDNTTIDKVMKEDPYKKDQPLALEDMRQEEVNNWIPPNQRGMIDPKVFAEGISNVIKGIDESNTMKEWRKFARPLQAGDPVTAAQIKDFANMRRVALQQRLDTHKFLDTIPRSVRSTMIRGIEKPELLKDLPPAVQESVIKLIQENEALSSQAFEMGIIGNIKKPYAPHIIKNVLTDPVMREKFKKQGYIRTQVYPKGQRKHETFEAGEKAGVEYVDDIKVMADVNYQLKEAIYGKHFVNYIKQFKMSTGDSLIGMAGQDIPGYVSINHPAFMESKYSIKKWVEEGGKKYTVRDNQVTIGDKTYPVKAGQIYINGKNKDVKTMTDRHSSPIKVHPDIAAPLQAVLEANNPNIITKSIVRLKAATIGIIMYNPAFHNLTVFGKIMPTLPGAGFGTHIWNPQKIIGADVYNHLTPPQKVLSRTWVSDYAVGNYLNKLPDKVTDAIQHNVAFIGGRGYRQDLFGELGVMKENILHNLSQGMGDGARQLGDFWHGTLLWDRIADAQMGIYNRYSIQFTEKGIKQFIKENKREPLPDEIKQIEQDAKFLAGETANTMVGAFGKEDFGSQWSNFLNTTLFSRSYTMSNNRLAQYAAGTMPQHLLGQMKIMDPRIAQKVFTGMALTTIVKDLFLLFGTLQGFNYIATQQQNIPNKNGETGGHFTWDNEPGKEMHVAVGEKEDGTVVYMGIPFRAARDIVEMSGALGPQKFFQLWNYKLNPILKAIIDEITNRDWRGKNIRLEGDDWTKQIADSAKHFGTVITGYDSMIKTFNPDDESWRNRYNFLGLQMSQGGPGGMVSGNLLQLQREQQVQRDTIMQEAIEYQKRGNEDKAIQVLLDNNLFTEIPGFILRSQDPAAAILLRLNWAKVYGHATPEQKERLDAIKFGHNP